MLGWHLRFALTSTLLCLCCRIKWSQCASTWQSEPSCCGTACGPAALTQRSVHGLALANSRWFSCSLLPPMPGPVSSAPSPLPNMGPVNFGLPGLGSTAHLLIGAAAVVNPKSSTLPSTDPQLQGPCSLHLSPVMSRSHGSVQPGSPAYGGLPASTVKLQQVSPKGSC